MKIILSIICLLTFQFVQAQNVGLKVDDISVEEGTTIEIKKGVRPAQNGNVVVTPPNAPLFEITEGEESIDGDGAPLLKEARNNHKKACAEWKKEFKEMNKENKIITMNCGKPACATEAMETVCTSKATYKMKVRLN
jgi:hypothetical protein